MYKLIALDLDGTALTSENKITEETRDAIFYARSKGVKVILATGRIAGEAAEFAFELGADDEMISSGGAAISNASSGVSLTDWAMDYETGAKVVSAVEHLPVTVMIYVGDKLYLNPRSDEILSKRKRNEGFLTNKIVLTNIADRILEDKLPVNKVFARSNDRSLLDSAAEKISPLPAIRITTSAIDNIEVMPKNADKGTALSILAKSLGITMDEVIAIGDSDNDYDMLKAAGVAVVMGNGDDKTKQLAHYITDDNDHNGVANAIYHFIK